MFNTTISLFLAICLSTQLFAQETVTENSYKQPGTSIRLSLMFPKLSIEQKLTEQSSLVLKAAPGMFLMGEQVFGEPIFAMEFNLSLSLEPRYYYAMKNRIERGRRIDNYSGPFLGLPMSVGTSNGALSAGAVWGYQKSINENIYFNFSFGYGIGYYDDTLNGVSLGEVSFGFILNP